MNLMIEKARGLLDVSVDQQQAEVWRKTCTFKHYNMAKRRAPRRQLLHTILALLVLG